MGSPWTHLPVCNFGAGLPTLRSGRGGRSSESPPPEEEDDEEDDESRFCEDVDCLPAVARPIGWALRLSQIGQRKAPSRMKSPRTVACSATSLGMVNTALVTVISGEVALRT